MALPTKIGLILCSTRTPRVGPAVAEWLATLITPLLPPNTTLDPIDLAEYATLPLTPSGPLPAQYPLPLADAPYPSHTANAWSARIRGCAGYIFVTPQYNWSFPASIKVALDHTFHEWAGKPAVIVSYGGRGGDKANTALRGVLNGLRMDGWEGRVELVLGSGVASAANKGVLEEAVVQSWVEAGKDGEVRERVGELVKIVGDRATLNEGRLGDSSS